MKKILILLILIISGFNLYSQSNKIDSLIEIGIKHHERHEFDKALEYYKKALEIDPNSTFANYEAAYTYFMMNDMKNAEKYSKIVIEKHDSLALQGYILYGSVLDVTGEAEKSVKVYEQAMEDYDYYLLYYNHALSCLNLNKTDKAVNSLKHSISNNPAHSSSHILLSQVMAFTNQSRIKSILPLYFALLLEPNSNRSNILYKSLTEYLNLGVDRTSDSTINVSLPIFGDMDSTYRAVEVYISLNSASRYLETNETKSESELFAESTKGILGILKTLTKNDKEAFWFDTYIDFFSKLAENNHTEAFSYLISENTGKKDVNDWLIDNSEKVDDFLIWVKKQ